MLVCAAAMPAHAACPIELAVYGEKNQAAEIDFRPATDAATVTNSFKMALGNFVLDGFVQWTEGESRPYGTLHYNCPTGDVTGEEYAACTVWQGVFYTANEQGVVDLLPARLAEEGHVAATYAAVLREGQADLKARFLAEEHLAEAAE